MHRDFMTVVGGNVGSAKVNSLPALLFQNRLATLALDAAFQLLLALGFSLVANRIDNILHPAGNQGAAGKHNHRKLRPAVLDRSGDCLAVHFWHFIINNYGICGIRIDKIQSQASARGSENTKTQSLKNSFEHGQARLVVIDPYQCLWLWSRNFNFQPKLGPGNATVARRETPLTRRCDW